jgi:hypothetical protein
VEVATAAPWSLTPVAEMAEGAGSQVTTLRCFPDAFVAGFEDGTCQILSAESTWREEQQDLPAVMQLEPAAGGACVYMCVRVCVRV